MKTTNMTFNEAQAELSYWKSEQRVWARQEGRLTRDEFARKNYVNAQVQCGERLLSRLSAQAKVQG